MKYLSTWFHAVLITSVLFITSLFSPLIDLFSFLFLKIAQRADEFTPRVVLNNYEEEENLMPIFTCQQCQHATPIGTAYYCTNPDSDARSTVIELTDESCEDFEHVLGEGHYK